MGPIKLKELDFGKMRHWVKSAKDRQQGDPVYAFISAWIGFNYYYYTFASTRRDESITWSKMHFSGSKGDKSKLFFLIGHSDFKAYFSDFKKRNAQAFEKEIRLPVRDMLFGTLVPEGLNGLFKFKDLSEEQIFQVIYQIRNNLFHGAKDPAKNDRDKQLSTTACEFMIPFLVDLIENTYGEEKSAYEPFVW